MDKHLVNFLNKRTSYMYRCLSEQTIRDVMELYTTVNLYSKHFDFDNLMPKFNKTLKTIFKHCDEERHLPLLAFCIYEFLRTPLTSYFYKQNSMFISNPEILYRLLRNKYTAACCHSDTIIQLVYRSIQEQVLAANNNNYFIDKIVVNCEIVETILQKLKKDFYTYLRKRMEPLKEELIMKAWSPKRIEKWLSAGFTIEEITEL